MARPRRRTDRRRKTLAVRKIAANRLRALIPLIRARPGQRKTLCKRRGIVKGLCELSLNVLKGSVRLPNTQLEKFRKHRYKLRSLVDPNVNLKKKSIILQKGGFLGALIPLAATLIGSIIR